MGYLYAIISSLFLTLYALPKKKSKLKPYTYVLFMGISSFLLAIIFYLLFGINESLFNNWLIVSFIGGIVWFIASALFFYCVDKMGVARASEFKSLQGPIGSILILTILSEFVGLNIYLLLLAIVFMFLSAYTLVINDNKSKNISFTSIFWALISALMYGVSGFIRKVVTLEGFVYSQQIYTSLGIMLSAFLYTIIKDKRIILDNKKSCLLAITSGISHYLASFFMLISYKYIEGSIAFTIIQLNSIWTCLIGIFIFKEIDYKKYYKRLLLGLLFAIIGIILLVTCS